MFVVIFQAQFDQLDDEYEKTARMLRERAFSDYNCLDFVSRCEGKHEITLSYWKSRDDIENWKNDALHQIAQENGKRRWYRSYKIEIAEVVHTTVS